MGWTREDGIMAFHFTYTVTLSNTQFWYNFIGHSEFMCAGRLEFESRISLDAGSLPLQLKDGQLSLNLLLCVLHMEFVGTVAKAAEVSRASLHPTQVIVLRSHQDKCSACRQCRLRRDCPQCQKCRNIFERHRGTMLKKMPGAWKKIVPLFEDLCSSNHQFSGFWCFARIETTISELTLPRSDQLSRNYIISDSLLQFPCHCMAYMTKMMLRNSEFRSIIFVIYASEHMYTRTHTHTHAHTHAHKQARQNGSGIRSADDDKTVFLVVDPHFSAVDSDDAGYDPVCVCPVCACLCTYTMENVKITMLIINHNIDYM